MRYLTRPPYNMYRIEAEDYAEIYPGLFIHAKDALHNHHLHGPTQQLLTKKPENDYISHHQKHYPTPQGQTHNKKIQLPCPLTTENIHEKNFTSRNNAQPPNQQRTPTRYTSTSEHRTKRQENIRNTIRD